MKFRLFKKNKDKVVRKTKTVRKPKLRTPRAVLGKEKSDKEWADKLFVDWFNNALSDKLQKGLNKIEAVNHRLVLYKMPVECAVSTQHTNNSFADEYLKLQPNLTKLMEGSNFKVEEIFYGNYFENCRVIVSWNVTHEQTKDAKERGLLDASIMQKYELDDDKGFIKEFNEILSPSNELNKYICDYYRREVRIPLSNFSDKYIEAHVYTAKDNKPVYRSCLYDRYEELLLVDGWYAGYQNEQSDSADTNKCELIIREKTPNH